LSRDLFPNDYHCLGDNENRPVKWMAIETLEKKFHTTSSDVWSLGVLLWELATLAAMPFEVIGILFVGSLMDRIRKLLRKKNHNQKHNIAC
jgi:RYK receptor-like tyrosine kinase